MTLLTTAQVVEGLSYAFPNYMKSLAAGSGKVAQLAPVFSLRDKVAEHPSLLEYLGSKDRRKFNE